MKDIKGIRNEFHTNEPIADRRVTLDTLLEKGYHPVEKLANNKYRFWTLAKSFAVSSITVVFDEDVALALCDKAAWVDSLLGHINPVTGEFVADSPGGGYGRLVVDNGKPSRKGEWE